MILNSDRDAAIKQLINHLDTKAREFESADFADLANCLRYMHNLWKLEVKSFYENGGRVQ